MKLTILLLISLFCLNAFSNETHYQYLDLNDSAVAASDDYCGKGKSEIVELGLIQGNTKMIHFICVDEQ